MRSRVYLIANVHATDVPTRQEVHAKQSEPIAKVHATDVPRERCIISGHQWSRVSEGGNDSANECH